MSKLDIGGSLSIEYEKWEHEDIADDVSFEFVEQSQDHWSSDNYVSVPIDKEKAVEIVNFLSKAFNLP